MLKPVQLAFGLKVVRILTLFISKGVLPISTGCHYRPKQRDDQEFERDNAKFLPSTLRMAYYVSKF